MKLNDVVRFIERQDFLDAPAQFVSGQAVKVVGKEPLKSALSGRWVGHPLHPVLTDLPIGLWTSALVLDLVGGEGGEDAADRLLGLGILTSLPTAAAGIHDWVWTMGEDQRVGLVHAVANEVALVAFAGSWLLRKGGNRGGAKVLALAASAGLLVGGYLGGHLSYARGLGVDRTAFEEGPSDWTDVLAESDLAEATLTKASAGGVEVMLFRRGRSVNALSNTCSHLGGPLNEGEVADGCVVCPWHASRFDLSSGEVVEGPASMPQPVYDARLQGGRVEVRLRTDR
ncbi:MAG: hypothetical protein NVSMB29_14720 [Candidatus Dormibacteria bacterium]